jgi:hypothetical protein
MITHSQLSIEYNEEQFSLMRAREAYELKRLTYF